MNKLHELTIMDVKELVEGKTVTVSSTDGSAISVHMKDAVLIADPEAGTDGKITIVEPVVHRLINTSVGITELSPDSQVLTGRCMDFNILFASPISGLKIHIQIADIATTGTTVGR